MLGYSIKKEDVKLISKVNFIKTEFEDTRCLIYINTSMTYGLEEYYLVGKVFQDYKSQGCYTYIDGIEKEYKGVKPVLNAIMKKYSNCGLELDKILIYAGLKKDIKETRMYKKLVKEQTQKNETVEILEQETEIAKSTITQTVSSVPQPEKNENDFKLNTEEQTNLDFKIKRAIESQAFEVAMTDMGYKTLGELDRDKNSKSLMPMFFTKHEEFDYKTKEYGKQLTNDTNFIKNIKQTFINDLKETAKIKEYEEKVWVTEDKDLTLDELKYKYDNDVIAEIKYKKSHKENKIITPVKQEQPQNKIIEQVSSELTKNELYEALQNNDIIGYTFNLRGIPQAIYENYDINDRLFIVINPSKLQAEYVDFYIYSLNTKVHEVYSNDDMKQLENLYHNDYTEFLKVIKEAEETRINQYSFKDIEKYFVELFNSSNSKAAITEPITTVLQDQQPSELQEQPKQFTHSEVFQDKKLGAYDCNQKLYSLYENNLIKPVFTDNELECIKSNNESYYNRIDGIIKAIEWNKHLMFIDKNLNYLNKLYNLEQRLMSIRQNYLVQYQGFKINKLIIKELKYKNYQDVFFNYIGFNKNDIRFRDDLIKHLLNRDNFNNIKESYIKLRDKAQTKPEVLNSEAYQQYEKLVNKLEPIFAIHGTIDAWMEEQVI